MQEEVKPEYYSNDEDINGKVGSKPQEATDEKKRLDR